MGKMQRVLFAAGDVGGARALIPIIEHCHKMELPYLVLNWGHISKEKSKNWFLIEPAKNIMQTAKEIYFNNDIGVLVFSSSLQDILALKLARYAKKMNIPTIHVLDNWTSYRYRMEIDGLPIFKPDFYTAIDDIAYKEILKRGFKKETIIITGQPALSSLAQDYFKSLHNDKNKILSKFGFNTRKKIIIFVSEPVEKDQGVAEHNPYYRGYTEKSVLKTFSQALQSYSDLLEIGIIPHPREDADSLAAEWQKFRMSLKGELVRLKHGRDCLFIADGVAGMASILLYEAWLLGKPLISLQPEVRFKELRMLQHRSGVFFADSYSNIRSMVKKWIDECFSHKPINPREELLLHKDAPEKIYELIMVCQKKSKQRVKI